VEPKRDPQLELVLFKTTDETHDKAKANSRWLWSIQHVQEWMKVHYWMKKIVDLLGDEADPNMATVVETYLMPLRYDYCNDNEGQVHVDLRTGFLVWMNREAADSQVIRINRQQFDVNGTILELSNDYTTLYKGRGNPGGMA